MEKITASLEKLFEQAPMTAKDYMNHARITIDELFGEGYAEKNPELIGQFMRTSAADYNTMILGSIIQDLDETIKNINKG